MNNTVYLEFAREMNQNISNLIHLCNNLRYNTFQLQRQPPSTFVSMPLNFPVNPPINAPINPPLTAYNRTRFLPRRPLPSTQRSRAVRRAVRTTLHGRRQGPTAAEINQATEQLIYGDISTNYLICPITQNNFLPTDNILRLRECQHVFTESALQRWFETSYECPICRFNIRNNRTENIINNTVGTNTDPPSDTPFTDSLFAPLLARLNRDGLLHPNIADLSQNYHIDYAFSVT